MEVFPTIIKADGTRETFDPEKLVRSLARSGAGGGVRDKVLANIRAEIRPGMTTRHIYSRAFRLLRELDEKSVYRYSLRKAVLELGPSGYPFEDFVAELYRALGYKARTREMVAGACVSHEVDVMLSREKQDTYIEVKFHNKLGIRTDVKTALYIKARADDVAARLQASTPPTWQLITNTKFTSQAIAFGTCAGLDLVSWDYPEEGRLQVLIERAGVHPLTCLSALSKRHKADLMMRGVVLARDLMQNPDHLRALSLPLEVEAAVHRELEALFNA